MIFAIWGILAILSGWLTVKIVKYRKLDENEESRAFVLGMLFPILAPAIIYYFKVEEQETSFDDYDDRLDSDDSQLDELIRRLEDR